MAVDIPARTACQSLFVRAALGIDGDHDALRAVTRRGLLNHLGVGQCGRIKAGLVSAGIEQAPHVLHRAQATAHSQWNKDLRGDCFNDVQDQVAVVAGGGDVQKSQLVSALVVVARSDFDRVTGVAQLEEIDALDDASAGDIQAGDDSFGEHQALAMPLSR